MNGLGRWIGSAVLVAVAACSAAESPHESVENSEKASEPVHASDTIGNLAATMVAGLHMMTDGLNASQISQGIEGAKVIPGADALKLLANRTLSSDVIEALKQ